MMLVLVIHGISAVSAAETELVFDEGPRTWRDASGNHQVTAELEKYESRELTLRLADGKNHPESRWTN